MRKAFFFISFWALAAGGFGQIVPIVPASGREEPTTDFISHTSREAAQADVFTASPYYKVLEGPGEFFVPFDWADKQLFLSLDPGGEPVFVVVNGREVGFAEGAHAPVAFDLTAFAREGKNTLAIDGDVKNLCLKALPRVRVRDFDIRTDRTEGYRNGVLDFGVIVKSHWLNEKSVRVYFELFSPAGELLKADSRDVTLRMRGEEAVHFEALVPDAEREKAYAVMIRVQNEGRYTEYIQRKVIFRHIEQIDGRLLIDGNPVERSEKYHIPAANMDFSRYGFAPGTTPANDPAYLDVILDRVKTNYYRTRNEPSTVAFSLGESAENGYDFHEAYLWMKARENVRPVFFPGADGEWNSD